MTIEELEAELGKLDAISKTTELEVNVTGESESSGRLTVEMEQAADVGIMPAGAESLSEGSFSLALLDLNLEDVEVPDSFITDRINAAMTNLEAAGGIPDVAIRQTDTTGKYELREDYTYSADGGFEIDAKTGFIFDRASIPRLFWVIIAQDDVSNVAPLFHDMLYRVKGVLPRDQVRPFRTFERKDADKLFNEIMKKRGVSSWRRKLAFQAVRKFGKAAWGG
jgi:hypothetical protein